MTYQIDPAASTAKARVWTYNLQDRSPRTMCAEVDAMHTRKALREVPDATVEILGHRHTPTGRHSLTIRRERIQPAADCGPNCYVATEAMQYEKGLITDLELAAGQPPQIIHRGPGCATLHQMVQAIQPAPVATISTEDALATAPISTTSDTEGDTTMTAKTATATRTTSRRSTRAAAKPAAPAPDASAPKTVPAGQPGLHADGTYTCHGCGATHPRDLEHFNADKASKDGLWSRCRQCGRDYANAYEAKRRAAAGLPAAQPRGTTDSAAAKALAAAAAAVPDAALNDQAFVESDAGQAALALKAEAAKAARRAADRDRKRAARAAAKEAAAN